MNYKRYLADKNFVIHLKGMARKYDSEFLRGVADRMDKVIEENIDNDREQLSKSKNIHGDIWSRGKNLT